MRRILPFILLFFFGQFAVAQKVKVENAIDNLGDGYNSSYRVSVPHASEKLLTKRWTSFLDDNKAKVKTSKKVIVGHHTIIKGLGPDTMEVYSTITGEEHNLLLTVAFQRSKGFITTNDAGLDKQVQSLLRDFALRVSKEGVEERVEEASDLLKSMVKEQSSLTNSNKRMASENERMKKTIETNESNIQKNTTRLEELKTSITSQQGALDNTKALTKELE